MDNVTKSFIYDTQRDPVRERWRSADIWYMLQASFYWDTNCVFYYSCPLALLAFRKNFCGFLRDNFRKSEVILGKIWTQLGCTKHPWDVQFPGLWLKNFPTIIRLHLRCPLSMKGGYWWTLWDVQFSGLWLKNFPTIFRLHFLSEVSTVHEGWIHWIVMNIVRCVIFRTLT